MGGGAGAGEGNRTEGGLEEGEAWMRSRLDLGYWGLEQLSALNFILGGTGRLFSERMAQ